ncbi:GIY-YIG nuclease family protein [Vibrio sp. 10N.261.51.F11]|uniref:GIY-YIG nuclease family protein n=1 Tax=Vibrio sp. 10N.261.51.F11 TaxID=3229678 RepID=UPI0035522723
MDKLREKFELQAQVGGESKLGYVYVLSNPAFPHLVKIGYTTRCIEERLCELNAPTSLPSPFQLAFSFLCEDPLNKERLLHDQFQDQRFSYNREFFEVDQSVVVDFIITKFTPAELSGKISQPFRDELEKQKLLLAQLEESNALFWQEKESLQVLYDDKSASLVNLETEFEELMQSNVRTLYELKAVNEQLSCIKTQYDDLTLVRAKLSEEHIHVLGECRELRFELKRAKSRINELASELENIAKLSTKNLKMWASKNKHGICRLD